ncbi:AFH_G0044000.mRNA.1.CDS.1 [Saccharomyces cerevisiae]|nr:AFH_G0044000.mRNA.1.CDS.1 [Saccharomyces cerevisiae]CAI6853142.1 AFH_G0044000.mRNA.1.CDS.1 [Saccharomyces cerevisiae]
MTGFKVSSFFYILALSRFFNAGRERACDKLKITVTHLYWFIIRKLLLHEVHVHVSRVCNVSFILSPCLFRKFFTLSLHVLYVMYEQALTPEFFRQWWDIIQSK